VYSRVYTIPGDTLGYTENPAPGILKATTNNGTQKYKIHQKIPTLAKKFKIL